MFHAFLLDPDQTDLSPLCERALIMSTATPKRELHDDTFSIMPSRWMFTLTTHRSARVAEDERRHHLQGCVVFFVQSTPCFCRRECFPS